MRARSNGSRYDAPRGWFLPNDYLGHLEHPDDAAKRILREQVGIAESAETMHEPGEAHHG